jgi:GTP pyrophosphokinase
MNDKVLQPIVESYNVDEEYLYKDTYLFIKGYATGRKFKYTLKALPLARKVHNGEYRKGLVEFDGKKVQLPYLLHCLKVCSTLISLDLPMSDEELDILYACALLHDTLEDGDNYFPKGGSEFTEDYNFPPIIEEVIKLLSKHTGANEYELNTYFNRLKKNKFAILIKLADRSHNVEDLYNMKLEKLHKYVRETRDFIYPLCSYGKQTYPELSDGVTVLKSKILSLTELTETIVEQYEEKLSEKEAEIAALKAQLEKLQSKTE